jgi:hypothetical protein
MYIQTSYTESKAYARDANSIPCETFALLNQQIIRLIFYFFYNEQVIFTSGYRAND